MCWDSQGAANGATLAVLGIINPHAWEKAGPGYSVAFRPLPLNPGEPPRGWAPFHCHLPSFLKTINCEPVVRIRWIILPKE